VLQRITADADHRGSALAAIGGKVRPISWRLQSRLVNSRHAYHIAAANADECATNILAFIRGTRRQIVERAALAFVLIGASRNAQMALARAKRKHRH
jgi:hypothetical protein